jgi:hypothetical protein
VSDIEYYTEEVQKYMATRKFDGEQLLFLSNLIALAKLEMQLEMEKEMSK